MVKLIDIMTFVVFSTLCNVNIKVVNSFLIPSLKTTYTRTLSTSTEIASKRSRISYYYHAQARAQVHAQTKLFSTETSSEADSTGKARVVFLGTPDVAATTLGRIVEESKKDERCVCL